MVGLAATGATAQWHVSATGGIGGLAYGVMDGPTHGTLSFNADGTYAYQALAGYRGLDGFTFQVTDARGVTSTGQVTIGDGRDPSRLTYATLDPANTYSSNSLSDGLLRTTHGYPYTFQSVASSLTLPVTGTAYFEATPVNGSTAPDSPRLRIGIVPAGSDLTNRAGREWDAVIGYRPNEHALDIAATWLGVGISVVNNNVFTQIKPATGYQDGDRVGLLYDADAGTLRWFLNGVDQGVVLSGIPAGDYRFASTSGDFTVDYNFGQMPFSYADAVGLYVPDTLTGQEGDDLLIGADRADTIAGGAGDDRVEGHGGDDTYLFERGDGADIVANQGHGADGDAVRFGPGVEVGQLWFSQAGNHLQVSIIGTLDSATIEEWFFDTANHVSTFQTADGATLVDSQVANLVAAMAAMTPPPLGQTTLTADQFAALDTVLAANWQSN